MRNAKGFTLIELLIVIAIIAILVAVLIPNLLAARQRANDTAVLSYVRNVVTSVEAARDTTTGALKDPDDNALTADGTNCDVFVPNPPAVIKEDGCTVKPDANNPTEFTVEAEYTGGTKTKAVYKDGQIKLE